MSAVLSGRHSDALDRGRGDRIARWLLGPLLVLLAAAVFVFFVFFQTDQVSGDSMLPDLRNGDYLLVTKGYGTPVRGDVIVFRELDQGTKYRVVKRVVGVAGDVVQVTEGVATVNGIREPTRTVIAGVAGGSAPRVTVPEGSIYVLGDNRPVSQDSRYIGPVPLSTISGRAVFRFAPIGRMGLVR